MDCKVTCLGKPGTTFNMVVFDDPYLFKGGSSLTVHKFVGKVLDKIHDDFGKKLFKVEFAEEPEVIEESAPEPIIEDANDAVEIKVEPSVIVAKTKKVKSA